MIRWKIQFTPESSRLLSKLHPENKKMIKQAVNDLRKNPYAGKDLQEELFGFKSFRSKQYRIIYKIENKKLYVKVIDITPHDYRRK